jgi:hypothetical protein
MGSLDPLAGVSHSILRPPDAPIPVEGETEQTTFQER